jgi:hypothetical protein
MKERCLKEQTPTYKYYGARGITITSRWLGAAGYSNFLADIGRRPTPKHTLERQDNDKGYCPCNCYWADRFTQANNTRKNRFIEHKGLRLTHAQWSRRLGGGYSLIGTRLKLGWSETEAVTTPVGQRRK